MSEAKVTAAWRAAAPVRSASRMMTGARRAAVSLRGGGWTPARGAFA
jgi:hypothetical protein